MTKWRIEFVRRFGSTGYRILKPNGFNAWIGRTHHWPTAEAAMTALALYLSNPEKYGSNSMAQFWDVDAIRSPNLPTGQR